jgi:hypothetical protein
MPLGISSLVSPRTGFESTAYSPSRATTNGRASICGSTSSPPPALSRTMRSLALGVNSVGPTCVSTSPDDSLIDQRKNRRGTGIFWRFSMLIGRPPPPQAGAQRVYPAFIPPTTTAAAPRP